MTGLWPEGCGIAFGDEYEYSVTCLPLVSPVQHDEVPKPPSIGRRWRRRRRRIGASLEPLRSPGSEGSEDSARFWARLRREGSEGS